MSTDSTDSTDKSTHLAVAITCSTLWIILSSGFILLFWHRRHVDFIKKRNVGITMILGFSLSLTMLSSILFWPQFRQELRIFHFCITKVIMDSYLIIHVVFANLIRVLDLFYEYLTSQVEIAISDPIFHDQINSTTPFVKQASAVLDIGFFEKNLLRTIALLQRLRIPVTKRRRISRNPQNNRTRTYMNIRGRKNSPLTRYLTFFAIAMGLSTIVCLINLTFSPTKLFENPDATKCTFLDSIGTYAAVFLYCLIVPFILLAIRKVEDSFYMRQEHMWNLLMMYPMVTIQVVLSAIPLFTDPVISFILDPVVWVSLITFVNFSVAIIFPTLYSYRYERNLRCKSNRHSIDAFEKMLQDEDKFQTFQRTLANDMAVENGLFYKDIEHLRTLFDRCTQKGMFRDLDVDYAVDVMVERYFTPGSPCELNVTWATRKSLLRAYHDGERSASMFDQARAEVLNLMYWNSYPKWRRTNGKCASSWSRRVLLGDKSTSGRITSSSMVIQP